MEETVEHNNTVLAVPKEPKLSSVVTDACNVQQKKALQTVFPTVGGTWTIRQGFNKQGRRYRQGV